MYEIIADEVVVGKNVTIESGVILQGRSSKVAKRIVIGDNVFIGENTRSYVDDLQIGDYSAIHNHTLISGDLPCMIGHCCWVGQNSVLNSTGGLTIGNGVGIGAYSQLWSHIKHGDMLQGCRWNSVKNLTIDDDVWFVGHCIVSPIHAQARSMAMAGAVVTRDMLADRTYAGVPAKDVTTKLGPQFDEVALELKYERMLSALESFYDRRSPSGERTIKVVRSIAEADSDDLSSATIFDVANRKYVRRRTEEEFEFMKHLLRLQFKFFPSI
jgi:acetyltransferase-like isoleucine patch superfamily enzyme